MRHWSKCYTYNKGFSKNPISWPHVFLIKSPHQEVPTFVVNQYSILHPRAISASVWLDCGVLDVEQFHGSVCVSFPIILGLLRDLFTSLRIQRKELNLGFLINNTIWDWVQTTKMIIEPKRLLCYTVTHFLSYGLYKYILILHTHLLNPVWPINRVLFSSLFFLFLPFIPFSFFHSLFLFNSPPPLFSSLSSFIFLLFLFPLLFFLSLCIICPKLYFNFCLGLSSSLQS